MSKIPARYLLTSFAVLFLATTFLSGSVLGQRCQGAQLRPNETLRDCDYRLRGEKAQEDNLKEIAKIRAKADSLTGARVFRTPSDADRQAIELAGNKIAELRKIDPADVMQYLPLVGTKGALVKLFPDHDCTSRLTVRSDGLCSDYVVGSAAYSFRDGSYRDPRAVWNSYDLYFNQGKLVSKGSATLGVLISLGDMPIETVNLTTGPVEHLARMEAPKAYGEAREMAQKLDAGMESGGYVYTSHLAAEENATYALRVMAYEDKKLAGIGDKRQDLLVVFRIVRRYTDGSILLACKALQRKAAPKIRLSEERGRDFQTAF